MNSGSITSNLYTLNMKIDQKVCHKYDVYNRVKPGAYFSSVKIYSISVFQVSNIVYDSLFGK